MKNLCTPSNSTLERVQDISVYSTYPGPCNVRVSLELTMFNTPVRPHTVITAVEIDQAGSREVNTIAAALVFELSLEPRTEECSQELRYVWTNPKAGNRGHGEMRIVTEERCGKTVQLDKPFTKGVPKGKHCWLPTYITFHELRSSAALLPRRELQTELQFDAARRQEI